LRSQSQGSIFPQYGQAVPGSLPFWRSKARRNTPAGVLLVSAQASLHSPQPTHLFWSKTMT